MKKRHFTSGPPNLFIKHYSKSDVIIWRIFKKKSSGNNLVKSAKLITLRLNPNPSQYFFVTIQFEGYCTE